MNRIIDALGESFSLTPAHTTLRPAPTAKTWQAIRETATSQPGEVARQRRTDALHQAVTFLRSAPPQDREKRARFERDVPKLEAAGAAAVYPTGTPLEELVESTRALA